MKKEVQIVLLFSIAVSIYFMMQLYRQPQPSLNRHLSSGIATWQAPDVQKSSLDLKQLSNIKNPFSSRFFENANLCGFVKNSKNEWCAIFTSPGYQAKILEPGIPINGLTLLGGNGKYCRVKFGSVVREFRL